MADDDADVLSTPEDCERRAALLAGEAFAPLETYCRDIAAGFGPTPRFVSRDNPTGTARNLRRFLRAAGIPRRQTVLWNAVPWIIHAKGARNRAPRRAEIGVGLSLLPGFVVLLPRLRVVVTAGRIAALAVPVLREARPDLALFAMPHPSPTYVNTSPAVTARIAATLNEAGAVLGMVSMNDCFRVPELNRGR